MKSLQSKNDIESYISDLLYKSPADDAMYEPAIQPGTERGRGSDIDDVENRKKETRVLSDDNQYLSFSVAGSDFLIAAAQVISVKSMLTAEAYAGYRLYDVEQCLNLARSHVHESPQFVLILAGGPNFAIAVDRIYGLVTVPAERLLVRKNIDDRPWYTAISRDFQSALLDSHALGGALDGDKPAEYGMNNAVRG